MQELSALFGLDEEQLSKLRIYVNILKKYGRNFGVTTILDSGAIVIDHFWDSLMLLKFMDFAGEGRVLDVGSGGGFPGLPLKIAVPWIDLTLLDANFKKVVFLKRVVERLGVEGVTVVWDRVERLPRDTKYDIILFRAVGDVRSVVRGAMSLLSTRGRMVVYAGEDIDTYIGRLQGLFREGLQVLSVHPYVLPGKKRVRNLIFLGVR